MDIKEILKGYEITTTTEFWGPLQVTTIEVTKKN